LMFLEKLHPEIIKELSQALVDETYDEKIFLKYFGKSLQTLVKIYEKEERDH